MERMVPPSAMAVGWQPINPSTAQPRPAVFSKSHRLNPYLTSFLFSAHKLLA